MVIAIRKYTIDDILARLQGVKKNGSGYMACCPAHEDKNPSLSISEKDGKVLLKCFAGCSYEQIMTALNMPPDAQLREVKPPVNKSKKNSPLGKIVIAYPYEQKDGSLYYEHVRYQPKTFRFRHPDTRGGYINNMDGIDHILYRLPNLVHGIAEGKSVYIAEGERDVDNIRGLNLVATCNDCGAGKWEDRYSDELKGAPQAIIISDKDEPGRKHASEVALSVHNRGVPVKIIEMPGEFQKTEDGYTGIKDFTDWLNAGGTAPQLEKLVAEAPVYVPPLIQDSLREISGERYCVENGRVCQIKGGRDGALTLPLCNFTARVIEEITKDNGVEVSKFFRILGHDYAGNNLPAIEVSASSFPGLNWVVSEWGMRAIIGAGQSVKDCLREAMQLLSQNAQARHIYTHTGWRHINGQDIFLSQGGAIGCDGVDVDLEPQLQRYFLGTPDPEKLKESVRASLNFLYIADLSVTLPLWTTMYLSPLAEALEPAFTLWLVAVSGSYKSTLSALALCHFGDFDNNHLPASWRDTGNQLEKLLFTAKDLPLVIDDWAPGQDNNKKRELEAKAEHIIRAQGNHQGRGRMRSDTTSRLSYYPRGILVTSGEHTPSGHSHTARIISVRLEKEMVDLGLMTEAQTKDRHLYRQAMANYIAWLQPNWLERKCELRQQFTRLRAEITNELSDYKIHSRLPDVVAILLIALTTALEFAKSTGELKADEYDLFMNEGRRYFLDMAKEQGEMVAEQRPGQIAIEAIQASLRIGTAALRNKNDAKLTELPSGKTAIGWRDYMNGHTLLDPAATYQVIVQHCAKSNNPYTINELETWRDLNRMGFTEASNDGRPTVMARVTAIPKSFRVVKIKNEAIGLAETTSLPLDGMENV